ncbi:MAG: TolC family protein [Elusimicrobiota bacterium]|nr:TolC family protein [Elusimicrobiota bacterium]
MTNYFVENIMILLYNKVMKILLKLFLVFAVSNLCINRVSGETVSLQVLVDAAKRNNPEIIAAQKKWSAAKSKIWQEKTWDNPQLFIDWQKMPKNDFDLNTAEEKMYGISQMVPFPGKLSIKGKIAKFDAEKTEWEYKETELKILSELKISYAMYFYINKSIETYKQTTEIMNNFSKVAESKYVTGKASQGDVLRAQVEVSKMLNMIITMEQEKETVRAELNSLIGKNADEVIGEPEELTPKYIKNNWDEIKKTAIENNPDIRQQNASVSKSKWSKKKSYTEFLPDFDLTYRRSKMEMGNDSQDFMLGFTVPLWFWKPALGVKEMSDELKMAESERKNMELMAVYQAKEFFVKLKTAERLIKLYQSSVLPTAEQSLKVTESSYRADKEDFLNLLDSVRTLLDFQLEYYKYIAQYHQNLATLEKITGVKLSDGGLK